MKQKFRPQLIKYSRKQKLLFISLVSNIINYSPKLFRIYFLNNLKKDIQKDNFYIIFLVKKTTFGDLASLGNDEGHNYIQNTYMVSIQNMIISFLVGHKKLNKGHIAGSLPQFDSPSNQKQQDPRLSVIFYGMVNVFELFKTYLLLILQLRLNANSWFNNEKQFQGRNNLFHFMVLWYQRIICSIIERILLVLINRAMQLKYRMVFSSKRFSVNTVQIVNITQICIKFFKNQSQLLSLINDQINIYVIYIINSVTNANKCPKQLFSLYQISQNIILIIFDIKNNYKNYYIQIPQNNLYNNL
ncbi:hypothetical protein pb186bvf_010540 [Paramecium bursaria]